jgi:hypothetical protein
MRYVVLITIFSLCQVNVLRAQAPAQWNSTHPSLLFFEFTFDDSGTHMIVSGTRYDSCFNNVTALVVVDTAGVSVLDTNYELTYCSDEGPMRFAPNADGSGYYMITMNDNITPLDSCFVHFIDSSFALQWQQYVGRDLGSSILSYYGRNYISVEDGSNRSVFRFYQPGIVDTLNQVTHPYFNSAPQRVFAINGSIFEIGIRGDLDSAFVCMVYDTMGNFQNSFSFDADVNEIEVPQYQVIHNNRMFHVNYAAGSNIYPACSDLSGSVNWIDTLNYQLKGASLDTVNDVAYIFGTSSTDTRLFSYNFNTGVRIDSITLDSVSIITARIKSGPAGGVFLFYRQQYTNMLLLDQYDAQCNLIWRGYTSHPTCTTGCTPYDLNFDPLGNAYTVSRCSPCSNDLLVSKFSPSLVTVPENAPEPPLSIFPNPATTEVRIELNGQNGNHVVHISNSLGQIVTDKSFTGNNVTLDIAALPSGVYFVEVTTNSGQRITQKLIIQHP